MGTSGAFIAVCVTALSQGGPALLAALVVASSLFQFVLAAKLSLFRRLLTPTVAGTVVMLIAVTVMPLIFDMVSGSPDGSPAVSAPITSLATMVVIVAIALKATGSLRLWAPVIGIAVGSIVATSFGLYDLDRVFDAPWFGVPDGDWHVFEFSFGSAFWSLLPSFVFVTLIGAIETVGDAVAIQRVSWRSPRAVDYRAVQGAVAADGTGNLLSGLAGTVPNTTYSTSVSVTELTGIAARRVGVAIGISFIAMAFMPKLLALVLAIPDAVVGAYITVLMGMLFVVGMKIVTEDAIDYRRSLIAGGFLANGMTAGGLTAVILTLFVETTGARRQRLHTELEMSELPRIGEFLTDFAGRAGWDTPMSHRLNAVAEETLLTLLDNPDGSGPDPDEDGPGRTLRLTAGKQDGQAVLEFIAAASDENLEDRLAVLTDHTAGRPIERDLSLRMLRHHASSVLHQQYHELDMVTVHVDVPDPEGRKEA